HGPVQVYAGWEGETQGVRVRELRQMTRRLKYLFWEAAQSTESSMSRPNRSTRSQRKQGDRNAIDVLLRDCPSGVREVIDDLSRDETVLSIWLIGSRADTSA